MIIKKIFNRMKILSTKRKQPLKLDSFRDIIGKKVISKSGNSVGRVHDILLSGKGIAGIIASGRLRFSRLFIDEEFFGRVTNAVMLSIDPVISLIGKQVFDADGKKLGKVVSLVRKGNENDFKAVVVKRRIYSKSVEIPKTDVDTFKKNIILKKVYK